MENAKVSRKNFISAVSVLTAAAVCPPVLATAANKPATVAELVRCKVYLQAPRQHQITIRWLASRPVYSWVAYGFTADNLDQARHQSTAGLINADNLIQAVTIKQLLPGRTYYYRVVYKEILDFQPYKATYGPVIYGETASFTTLKDHKEDVEMWILNDIHDRPESFPQLLKFHEKTCDFIFLNGDMFNWQQNEQQLLDHLINPLMEASGKQIPYIFSRGNHEVRGIFARDLHRYFNGVDEPYYYSFQYGPMYIIVLDSGEDQVDAHEHYSGLADFDPYRVEQQLWLEQEVQKKEFKNAKFKVVFSHIPMDYCGDHGSAYCRELWGEIFNKAKINALISGHTHVYGMHPPVAGKHNYPIIIGGGPQNGNRTLMKLKADHEGLQIIAFDDEGKTKGSMKLS